MVLQVALKLTALLGLVRVVEAVVVVVADVDPGDAAAVGAGEEVSEARPPLHVALLLVGTVRAVLVAVAVPRGRDAAVVGAAERVGRAGPGLLFSFVVRFHGGKRLHLQLLLLL